MREWQTVTVALCAEQQLRHRLAEQVRAPDDDRFGAFELDAGVGQQLHHAQRACTGAGPGARATAGPALTGVRPSTSLSGLIMPVSAGPVEVLGQRQLQQDAADGRVGVQALELLGDLLEATQSPAGAGRTGTMPTSAQARCLPPT